MKKEILITLIFCLCGMLRVEAQLEKGTRYMAATLSFNGSNSQPKVNGQNSWSNNYVVIEPSLHYGKFIRDKMLLGFGIGTSLIMSWNKLSGQPTNRGVSGAYTFSPYMRHYKSIGEKWAIFLTSSLDFSYHKDSHKMNNERTTFDGYSGGVRLVPGISYWVTPRFAIESDINLLSVGAGYKDFMKYKSWYFNSAVTTGLNSYFSLRASWYINNR